MTRPEKKGPEEEGIYIDDDEILENLFQDMMSVTSEEVSRIRDVQRTTFGWKTLDQIALEEGKISVEQRDALFGQLLRERVKEMRKQLLGARLGSYNILEEIASGGMGIVFKARQESPMFTRETAIKFMLAGPEAKPEERERFIAEVKNLADLKHPNLVPIYDSGIEGNLYYFSMELIDGCSLEELALREEVSLQRRVEIIRDIARALAHLHEKGIVHRDVKPRNIMVDSQGTAKLLDFGIAQFSGDPRLRSLQAGTPNYVAPEIIEPAGGHGPIGPGADVYALGAVLYFLVFRREVFGAEGGVAETLSRALREEPHFPRGRGERIPAPLERIIARCLQKQVGARHASAGELARELDRYLRRPSRTPWYVAAALLVLTLLLAPLASRLGESPAPEGIDFGPWEEAVAELRDAGFPKDAEAFDRKLSRIRESTDPVAARRDRLEILSDSLGSFWRQTVAQAREEAEAARDGLLAQEELILINEDVRMFFDRGSTQLDDGSRTRGREAHACFRSATRHFQDARDLNEQLRIGRALQQERQNAAETAWLIASRMKSQVDETSLVHSAGARDSFARAEEKLLENQPLVNSTDPEDLERARAALEQVAADFESAGELAQGARQRFLSEKRALEEAVSQAVKLLDGPATETLLQNIPGLRERLGTLGERLETAVATAAVAADLQSSQVALAELRQVLADARQELRALQSGAESARERAARQRRTALTRVFRGETTPRMPAVGALEEIWNRARESFRRGSDRLRARSYRDAGAALEEAATGFEDFTREASRVLADMVWVESGSLGGQVDVDGFWIDRYEVAVSEYLLFLNHVKLRGHGACCPGSVGAYRSHLPTGWEDQVAAGGERPVVGVALEDALAFARWRGKSLPTPEMWELAATTGSDGRPRDYPYGERFDPELTHTPAGSGVEFLAPVRSLPGGASRSGCHHMSGNAAEWALRPATAATGEEVFLMGGSIGVRDPSSLKVTGPTARVRIHGPLPGELLRFVGFRCVIRGGEVEEP